MLLKKRQREDAEVPGSALADIAFLLLIFFLVVTTIDVDTGIGMVLPPKPQEDVEPPPVKERNMLKILVNAQGMVLVDEEPTAISEVKQLVIDFVDNYGQDPDLSENPDKAIVSIKTDRQTTYSIFIDMLDEVMGAYAELRNSEARQQFGKDYEQLTDAQQDAVGDVYPKKISIAEPDEG